MSQTPNQPPVVARQEGRCHICGYSLIGLAREGVCPECGTPFDNYTAARLKPWPSALSICLRLGWPIVGLMIGFAMASTGSDPAVVFGFFLGWVMIIAVAINSYFQVRGMLKRSLPNRVRTRGAVAIFRAIGTTVCVVVLLAFVGAPLVFGIACMVMLSRA